jgi:hypothetical protein
MGLEKGRTFKNGLRAAIGMMGEYGMIGYSIRLAQSIIRFDRQPSYWSHVFLFDSEVPADKDAILSRSKQAPTIWESTIDFTGPLHQLHLVNGVSPRYLRDYAKPDFNVLAHHCVPNIGVAVFALNEEEVQSMLRRMTEPEVDALRYDFSGLIGTWLAYIFNREREENPLGAGNAVFCSAYCQLVYDTLSIDLSMGAHARNTSPENIWQSVKWFSDSFARLGHPVRLYYCIRDPYCVVAPVEPDKKIDFSLGSAIDWLTGKK